MAAERPGLSYLAITELRVTATRARQELADVAREITPYSQRIERALVNLDFIKRLCTLPRVSDFLEATGVSIEIIGRGVFGVSRGLIVTRGVMSSYSDSGMTPVDEDVIRLWGKPLKGKMTTEEACNEELVDTLAKMKPRKIIRKFQKAISAPLRLELQ